MRVMWAYLWHPMPDNVCRKPQVRVDMQAGYKRVCVGHHEYE